MKNLNAHTSLLVLFCFTKRLFSKGHFDKSLRISFFNFCRIFTPYFVTPTLKEFIRLRLAVPVLAASRMESNGLQAGAGGILKLPVSKPTNGYLKIQMFLSGGKIKKGLRSRQ